MKQRICFPCARMHAIPHIPFAQLMGQEKTHSEKFTFHINWTRECCLMDRRLSSQPTGEISIQLSRVSETYLTDHKTDSLG